MVEQLDQHKVQVVICAFSLHDQSSTDAQVRLIRAADRSSSVSRFIPSEFNVDYDLGDDVLPYSDKKLHQAGRRALENTKTLEFAYIYPGMFMDYFGVPNVRTHLRPLSFFVDPVNVAAAVPGDGSANMSMTFTTDVARYLALALDLDKWPRVMTTATSTISIKELVELTEKNLGRKLHVTYQPIDALLSHQSVTLPENVAIAERFPQRFRRGLTQLRGLIDDLEAGVALGAFDFGKLHGHLDLVKEFKEQHAHPITIEALMEQAWKA